MTRDKILASLNEMFCELFDDPTIVLTADTTADDIEEWDSMNHITLVVEAERRFGLKFQTAEVEELKNVGEFVDLIANRMAKAA